MVEYVSKALAFLASFRSHQLWVWIQRSPWRRSPIRRTCGEPLQKLLGAEPDLAAGGVGKESEGGGLKLKQRRTGDAKHQLQAFSGM